MSNENNRTIQSYEARSSEYLAGTVQEVVGPMKKWLDHSLEGLPYDAQIFEIGSGTGRDAEYLQSQGYAVHCSDATQSFVDILSAKGLSVRSLNIITDSIEGNYDAIIANAVLLHFTDEETQLVLHKVLNALNDSGRFAFSVKVGEGDAWTDGKIGLPRYFNFWDEETLRLLLDEVGFRSVSVVTTGKAQNTWLMVTAYK